MEYEGVGYREVPHGWELKVKPWTPAAGLRWRTELSRDLGFQMQYWTHRPTYAAEFGNSQSATQQQTGQMELSLQSLWIDLRRPLAGSPVEVVFGLNGLHHQIRQKDVSLDGIPEPGSSHETQMALGGHLGFHGKGQGRPLGRGPALFWDGEILLGHYFWTHNQLDADGGSVDQGGYTYALRLEGGVAWPRWRVSVGYARQLYEMFVPEGRRFTAGADPSAAASLPINKIDLFGPFLAVGWTY
jgi:hypothetical protein